MSYLTPPFQNPDEGGHFKRVAMIAAGQFVAHPVSGGWSGGRIDGAIVRVIDPFELVPGHPERRLDPAAVASVADVKWGSPAEDVAIWGTVMYSPALYLPAAAGIRLGQLADMTILATLRTARLLDLLVAGLLGTIALLLMPGGRTLLFVVLTLPMSLAMFGALSNDGLMITGAALAAAAARREHAGLLMVAAALIAAIGAARPIYALLAVLLLQRQPLHLRRLLLFLLALIVIAAWWHFGAPPWIDFPRDDIRISTHEQLDHLRAHPGHVLTVAIETLRAHAVGYAVMTIGVLGSVDTVLPVPYYLAAGLVLLVALATDASTPSWRPPIRDRALAALALLAALGATFLAQYLSWTEVGGRVIKGVQGRYFLPLFPLAIIMIAGSAPRVPIPRAPALVVCVAFPLLTAAVVPWVLHARYALGPE